jgi:tetratricopeptide (TPR) repeat protein
VFEGWFGAELGRDPDCAACVRHADGAEAAALRRDEEALELWAPVLDGDLICAHQPHGVLGSALMVLLRRDEIDRAMHAHHYGYRISRRKPGFRAAIGEHLEFCALTGNEHRGLELLAEHADWLTEPAPGIAAQAEFLTGASVLLARLVALGHTELPVPMPPSPGAHLPAGEDLAVGVLRGFVDAELDSLAARIARSEQEAGRAPQYAARLRTRRLRQPALIPFELPTRTTLREPAQPAPPYAEPAASHLEVPGMEDLYALTDTLYQAGELDEVGAALRQVIERSLAAGAPWYAARAEMNLSRLLAADDDRTAAVRMARASVMDCVDARLRGSAALTLATALWELDGREAEAILPALEAAEIYTADERGSEAALARLRAADALMFTGRRRPAVTLYERSFAELDDEEYWDPREYGSSLARHSVQYARTLLMLGNEDEGIAVLDRVRKRIAPWPDDAIRFEVAVNTAYALRDNELSEQALEAFLRAAQLAVDEPDRLQMRVRCLRSAAWLCQRTEPDRATRLMDEAGEALVLRLSAEPEPTRNELRLELAETHLQRAELTASSQPALALRDADAALRGLREGLEFRRSQQDASFEGVYGRLAEAAILLGRLEVRRGGSTAAAAKRLSALVEELEAAGGEGFADLVKELAEQIDGLSAGDGAE